MTYKCSVSGEAISPERVEALKVLGVPESKWTNIKHSQVKKLRGVYAGDDGSNDIVICDAVDGGSLFDNEVVVEVENEC
jgi:2-polyprenyl-6-methoxyphenol hydroxylase-like FAD-dependent oxidoreductase